MVDTEFQFQKSSLCKMEEKTTVYVEIQLNKKCVLNRGEIQARVKQILQEQNETNGINLKQLANLIESQAELREHVNTVGIICDDERFSSECESSTTNTSFRQTEINVQYCIYKLNYDEPATEGIDDNSDLAAATHWILPCVYLHGLWENLIYDCNVKLQLLNFATTTLLFSDKKVDSNIISWNRVVLLHGPPGTGKTSLCKALAQKLSIRFNHRYSYGQLIEINSHSLFSKWFSESGKLVMKMFEKIQEFIDDPKALVILLIDEVESLAHARKTTFAGNEPSDAIRVVNAILTQLDAIKKYSNVLILTTSNVTGAIDLAFVDRADIKQYIGLPSTKAIYKIYETCLAELIRTGIIWQDENCYANYKTRLSEISEKSNGLSGRTLRKLPFLAHALNLQKSVTTMSEFLDALSKTVDRQFEEGSCLKLEQ